MRSDKLGVKGHGEGGGGTERREGERSGIGVGGGKVGEGREIFLWEGEEGRGERGDRRTERREREGDFYEVLGVTNYVHY